MGYMASGSNPGRQRWAATQHCFQSSLSQLGKGKPSQLQRLILYPWWSSWKCPTPRTSDFDAQEATRGQDTSGRPPNLAGKLHPRAAGLVGGKLSYGLCLYPRPFPPVSEMLEASCARPKSCDRPARMGKDVCLSGEHLKKGKEGKTGISFESQQQVGTRGETEA